MTRVRSIFAGDTDYTGVPLADIVEHLRQWRDSLCHDVEYLGNVRQRLALHGEDAAAKDGLEFLDRFVDLFDRYKGDLERLIRELPQRVNARHVEIVAQIFRSSRSEELLCVEFKRRHYLDALHPDNVVQNTLAEIYRCTRDAVVNLRDLGDVATRLTTYVSVEDGVSPSATAMNALELKPNVFGVGINLNFVWDRWGIPAIRRWFQNKRG